MPLRRARWLAGRTGKALALWGIPLLVLAVIMAPAWWGWLHPTSPPPPFEYGADPFPLTDPGPFRPGDTPELVVSRCNRLGSPLTYTISRVMQRADDGRQWYLATIAGTAPPGCQTVLSRAHTIPADAAPGRYKFLFVAAYSVPGEGRVLTAVGQSAEFEVLAR
jgi:hypothetical protein